MVNLPSQCVSPRPKTTSREIYSSFIVFRDHLSWNKLPKCMIVHICAAAGPRICLMALNFKIWYPASKSLMSNIPFRRTIKIATACIQSPLQRKVFNCDCHGHVQRPFQCLFRLSSDPPLLHCVALVPNFSRAHTGDLIINCKRSRTNDVDTSSTCVLGRNWSQLILRCCETVEESSAQGENT